MTGPLLVTRDETLLDELTRLAAAAGVTPEVARDGASALRTWLAAPLVLLGDDLADELALLAPSRRPGVHLVSWGRARDEVFRTALALGAEDVTGLPASATWVTELLTDLGESGRRRGATLAVIGGSGGAGASTLACALGQVAARDGSALVVDADPLGPGLDRVLGLEPQDGVRWDALCQTTGRLSARSLREALPRRAGLAVLTWGAAGRSLQAFAVREALSAGARGHDTVVVDLPRHPDPLVEEVAARCDLLLVVAVPSVPGLASAARVVARFPDHPQLRVVARGKALDPRALSRVVGAPVLATMGEERRLAEALDLGLGPVRSWRGPLGRTASEVLRIASLAAVPA